MTNHKKTTQTMLVFNINIIVGTVKSMKRKFLENKFGTNKKELQQLCLFPFFELDDYLLGLKCYSMF